MITKVVISPTNKKAITFLNDISKSKASLKSKLEAKAFEKMERLKKQKG